MLVTSLQSFAGDDWHRLYMWQIISWISVPQRQFPMPNACDHPTDFSSCVWPEAVSKEMEYGQNMANWTNKVKWHQQIRISILMESPTRDSTCYHLSIRSSIPGFAHEFSSEPSCCEEVEGSAGLFLSDMDTQQAMQSGEYGGFSK